MIMENLLKAIENKDSTGIIAIFNSLEYGLDIDFLVYCDILNFCDPRYISQMKKAIARNIFLPAKDSTERKYVEERYPFLKNFIPLAHPSYVNYSSLEVFFKCIDDAFKGECVLITNFILNLKGDDVGILNHILSIAEPHLRHAILSLGISREVDRTILRSLVRHAVYYDELSGIGFADLALDDVEKLAPKLNNEEVFALLYEPEEMDWGHYEVPRGEKKIKKLNSKERMILLRYYFEKGRPALDNDGMYLWLENEALKRNSPFERIMAIKVLARFYETTALSTIFASFASTPLKPDGNNAEILQKYVIYPREGDSLFDSFFGDIFSNELRLENYLALMAFGIYSGTKYHKLMIRSLLDLLNFSDLTEGEALANIINKVRKHKPIDLLFLDVLLVAGQWDECRLLQEFELNPDQEYYIKCYGGDTVAVVKPVYNSEWNKLNRSVMLAYGIKDLVFCNPNYAERYCGSYLYNTINDELVFEVVRLEGSIQGTELFYILGNDGELVQLKVGDKINKNKTHFKENPDYLYSLNYYYTIEDARSALFG